MRVAREGGARVAPKQLLRDTNLPLANPSDQRQLDMVAYGITRQGIAHRSVLRRHHGVSPGQKGAADTSSGSP